MLSRHALPAAATFLAPALSFAASYDIDPTHSSARFAVKHMMVSTVRGEFSGVTGTLHLDEQDAAKSTVEATIDASTISTGVDQRDTHLKSADFFDVAKFPTLAFKSTEVKKVSDGHYRVAGNLTMHGVTKLVVLDVESPSAEAKDPWGVVKRGAIATVTLNRKDFGLNWNKALEAGGVLVSDEVKITLDLELNRKAPVALPRG